MLLVLRIAHGDDVITCLVVASELPEGGENMRLCFGTFAAVLNHCRQNALQAEFVARIVRIVDPYNSCIVNKFDKAEIKADGPATTKLLKCKNDFVFVERENANKPTPEAIIKNFETEVAPFIDEDKKAKVILALLDIIEKDKCIDFDKKENFKKYLGVDKQNLLQQSEFIFSDFLGRILLYSTCGNVDNRVGQSCVKLITGDYIDRTAEPYAYEYQWDTITQTLVLSFVKIFNIFNQAILDYQINNFIENVDPTNIMGIEWVEYCESFLEYTKDSIWIVYGTIHFKSYSHQ